MSRMPIFFLSIIVLCFAVATPPNLSAAEPFAFDDFDTVFSDTGTVHYKIDRACLADSPTSPCNGLVATPLCTESSDLTSRNCNIGIHRFCVAKGHVSGFGVEDSPSGDVDITCVTSRIAEVVGGVPVTDLTNIVPACSSNQPSKPCSVAIDRYCRNVTDIPGRPDGRWLGFGPLDVTPTTVSITCLSEEVSVYLSGALTEVEQLAPGCSFASSTVSTACRQAMHEFCVDEGEPDGLELRGGFGPAEIGTSGLAVGCVEKRWPWTSNLPNMPQEPALPIDIISRKIDVDTVVPENSEYFVHLEHAALAPDRSLSFDGRVQTFQRMVGGVRKLNVRVQTPEIFTAPLTQAQAVARDRSYQQGNYGNHFGFDVDQIFLHASTGGLFKGDSTAICDPHQGSSALDGNDRLNRQQNVPARQSNPVACNSDGKVSGELEQGPGSGPVSPFDHDCYDLSLITVYNSSGTTGEQDLNALDELWESRVRVVVANPKGSDANEQPSATRANVIDVVLRDLPQNPRGIETMIYNILEPNITGDGRLLVIQGDGELRYSVLPDTAEPCDVTQWGGFKPISEMHADPDMSEYGIAKYPLRDHEGNVLSVGPPYPEIRAAYPWIDRDGDNMMFMLGAANLYYEDGDEQVHEKFDVVSHPVYGTTAQIPIQGSSNTVPLHPTDLDDLPAGEISVVDPLPREGLTFFGLWSQGKMFSPDNRNNAVDFAIKGGGFHHHRELDLYAAPAEPVEVGPSIRTSINSAQNQFFYYPKLLPDTPREVVWTVSTQDQTDEVAFDDVTDPRALIISPMNVSIKSSADKGRFQDGFEYTGDLTGEGFQRPAHMANAATSVSDAVVAAASDVGVDLSSNVQWNIPAYGYLLGGARAEPIAAGGFRGKGLWFDGIDDRLEYLVPLQPTSRETDMQDSAWFYSISIDPRDLTTQRRLLTLPDNNWIDILDSQKLRIGRNGFFDVTLPSALALTSGEWSTISLLSAPKASGGFEITVYLNGYEIFDISPAQDFLRMDSGTITVGAEHLGFLGWVDDFKVIARAPNPEVVCNHARGTLVGVAASNEPDYDADHAALAVLYPSTSHDVITDLMIHRNVGPTYGSYICERPISDPSGALDLYDHGKYTCLGQTRRTSDDRCLRSRMLFPEGLFHDVARKDSTANSFCTSCHIASNPSETMTGDALLGGGVTLMPDDTRRQPMQHPPKLFGNILEFLFGTWPAAGGIQATATGEPIDQYTTPAEN